MSFSQELLTLATYLVGEFDNREQALSEPVWYVHLCLWQRRVPLFTGDSITLFAEQANILYLDNPYRQRFMRLQQKSEFNGTTLQIQYYMPKHRERCQGGGRNPAKLENLTSEDLEFLPGCRLSVTGNLVGQQRFSAMPTGARCYFNYGGEVREVSLGFEAGQEELLSYDKGIDSATGQALWGAVVGPYRFVKRQQYEI